MSAASYPKRLIEVDLPIKDISTHARREKSIRHGHISTLHIWWARRPLAACRAVLCAALWPDPADELCPQSFRDDAAEVLSEFAEKVRTDKRVMELCADRWVRWRSTDSKRMNAKDPTTWVDLRCALLDFISDFANWDASAAPAFLHAARRLTSSAHQSLSPGGAPKPLVFDPFAGGGAIPLEALRVGADAFASDLNPLPVLLNKVTTEYVPRYGRRLAEAMRRWGDSVQRDATSRLAELYRGAPKAESPNAFLWARTIRCEGPGCGSVVPLLVSFTLGKRTRHSISLHPLRGRPGGELRFEIVEGRAGTSVAGTVRGGAATCPLCEYTTPNGRVRAQLSEHRGGAATARLIAVIDHVPGVGRAFRIPSAHDQKSVDVALARHRKLDRSFIPDEIIPTERPSPNARGLSAVTRIGAKTFGDLFTPRTHVTLATFAELLGEAAGRIRAEEEPEFAAAVVTCLAFAVDRIADSMSSLATWASTGEFVRSTFARQALSIAWDFVECNPLADSSGNWAGAVDWVARVIEATADAELGRGHASQGSATAVGLPDDAAQALFTDPPYYDSVPYADLSEFFYVWLRRSLRHVHPDLLAADAPPKDEEAIWNPSRIYSGTGKPKDKAFYERQMGLAFAEARRIVEPRGIGVVVFAHKSTAGWEAVLGALIEAGWIVTASWPIDTERSSRTNAIGTASLSSSVHLVCRPREDGSGHDEVGSWRAILSELPQRIHEWMPRLAREGVVGADAIFACIGPALEVFSRHSRVEKASGEPVALNEYLEQVWAAVAREALSMMFEGADASGFEEDARLTAMWLWTLGAGAKDGSAAEQQEDDAEPPDEAEGTPKERSAGGFVLEFDAARKIAQGLGAHLEKLVNVVEVKGDKARLLAVSERAKALFARASSPTNGGSANQKGKGKPSKKQLGLFAEVEAAEREGLLGEAGVPAVGETTLDRVHQAMILFGAGRSEALKRFVVEEGVGRDARFWKLAQSFSALYPASSDEKRWVDGVLARKKSLGF